MNFNLSTITPSNLDKHRQLCLPDRPTRELSLETGIDLGDGSLFHTPATVARNSYYVYSISQRFPDEWFGIECFLKPLIERLYNLRPKSKRSSLSRNGINVYIYSKGLFLFKKQVLALTAGHRSRNIALPSVLSHSLEHQASFWSGYQYADGSFYCRRNGNPIIKITTSSLSLINSLRYFAKTLGVDFVFGREHPDVGFSLRIYPEPSLIKWLQHVPLLNPVHLARFVLWRSGLRYLPGFHFSQYMDLVLGVREISQFSADYVRNKSQRQYLDETADPVSLVCLGKSSMAFNDWWHLANLRGVEEGELTVRRLLAHNYLTRRTDDTCRLELTDGGQSRLAEFNAFLNDLISTSPVSAKVITKLEEGLSC
jgi:hypothetical protein